MRTADDTALISWRSDIISNPIKGDDEGAYIVRPTENEESSESAYQYSFGSKTLTQVQPKKWSSDYNTLEDMSSDYNTSNFVWWDVAKDRKSVV